jgi:hypothetical protein
VERRNRIHGERQSECNDGRADESKVSAERLLIAGCQSGVGDRLRTDQPRANWASFRAVCPRESAC